MVNVLLITRCSRLEFLYKLAEHIIEQAKKFNRGKFTWFVSFDLNRIDGININKNWIEEMINNDIIEFRYSYSFSNDSRYGSNIANECLSRIPESLGITHTYLLDDDNTLHGSFYELCNRLKEDDEHITLFNQIRKDKEKPNTLKIVGVNYTISPENVVGWIDSAQFIIPYKILVENGGYEDGYCIDGLTIKKLLERGVKYECIKSTAAFYNYFTELEDIYHY